MIDISKAKIYIFCPPDVVSGGPEALHQLCYYMRKIGIESKMVYYFSHKTISPDRYNIYETCAIDYEEIEDDENNVLIVPETATLFLRCFKRIRKCIWWLSVDNYFKSKKDSSFIKDIIRFVFNISRKKGRKYIYSSPVKFSNIKYHFCGSQYAYDFLISLNKNIKPVMLVEPISKDFYLAEESQNLQSDDREDIILYNPAKPSKIMNKLLLRDDLNFKALRGYNPSELTDIYRHAKLYIDFGEFPGPERIPKESVYNGTCILVGKRNAAINDFDIPIPEFYKIDDYNNEDLVVNKIKYILNSYDKCIADFEFFRNKISNLENAFINDIKAIFVGDCRE